MTEQHEDVQAIRADRLMGVALMVLLVMAFIVAAITSTWVQVLLVGVPAALVSLAMITLFPGKAATRITVSVALMVFSALLIQQSHGMIEAHFSVFILMSLLLYYRNWVPILVAAVVIAVHHLVFNMLQADGVGIYLFPGGQSYTTVLIHAIFVVFEAAWLIYIAIQLRAEMDLLGGMPQDVTAILKEIAKGDLSVKMPLAKGDARSLMSAMQEMVGKLSQIIGDVRHSTDSINVAAREIASGNSDLSSRTEQQASSLEETASSMEELTVTVKQNAENASLASQKATQASTIAAKGGEVVGEVVRTMDSISSSSRKISDIISVIEGIAFQTNILALNAAVEAARAGEQGRGFAVVAAEVRNLAQRSATASKEIASLIAASVEKVELGTSQAARAGQTMKEVVSSVQSVTDLISEIAAA